MKMNLALAALFAITAFAFAAGSCPPGATDCFMCGASPIGVPCNRDCTAHSVPGLGYVSCELPQGEPPVCYCPYGGGAPIAGDDDSLIANAPDCVNPSGTCRDCGEIRSSVGTVAIKRNGAWCIAGEGIIVYPGDRVWVRAGGKARMMFSTGEQMDANSNSIFTVQSLNLDPPPGEVGRMVWSQVQGIYRWFRSSDRHEQFEVTVDDVCTTPKGTEVVIEATGSQVTVKVLEGEVSVRNKGSASVVNLTSGEYTTASKSGGAPSNPASFNPGAEEDWWSELGSGGCGSAFVLLLAPLLLALFVRR